ncbi:MAG: hypothetical protein ACFE0P_04180 [Oceanicaulis sp.]
MGHGSTCAAAFRGACRGRLSPRGKARYIRLEPGHASAARPPVNKEIPMAAIVALGLAFGIFALLNLIDNKRLD